MNVNRRFPVLTTIAKILVIAGWIVTALCGIGVLATIGNINGMLGPLPVFICLFGALFGVFTVAFGESIGVLFAIEENTRNTSMQRSDPSAVAHSTDPNGQIDYDKAICPFCKEPSLKANKVCEVCGKQKA